MLRKKQSSSAEYGNGVLSTVALVLMVLVLLLLCGGFASPGWVFLLYPGNNEIHNGLWYIVNCKGKCETVGVNNWPQVTKDDWLDNQIESCVAVGLAVLVFVLLLWQRGSSSLSGRFVMGFIAIILCIASGVLALIPVGQKGNFNRKIANDVHHFVQFPYSLFIFGLGAVFIFVVAMLLLCDIIRYRSHQARKEEALLATMNGHSGSRKKQTKVLTNSQYVKSSYPVYYGNTSDAVYVASQSPTVYTVPGAHYTYTTADAKPLRTSQNVTRSLNGKSQTLGHQSGATTTYVTRTTILEREQQQQREASSPGEYRVVSHYQQPVVTTSTTSFRESPGIQQRKSSPSVKRRTIITSRPMSATVRAVPTYYKQYIETERVARPQSTRSRPRSQKRPGSYYTSTHYVSLCAL